MTPIGNSTSGRDRTHETRCHRLAVSTGPNGKPRIQPIFNFPGQYELLNGVS